MLKPTTQVQREIESAQLETVTLKEVPTEEKEKAPKVSRDDDESLELKPLDEALPVEEEKEQKKVSKKKKKKERAITEQKVSEEVFEEGAKAEEIQVIPS